MLLWFWSTIAARSPPSVGRVAACPSTARRRAAGCALRRSRRSRPPDGLRRRRPAAPRGRRVRTPTPSEGGRHPTPTRTPRSPRTLPSTSRALVRSTVRGGVPAPAARSSQPLAAMHPAHLAVLELRRLERSGAEPWRHSHRGVARQSGPPSRHCSAPSSPEPSSAESGALARVLAVGVGLGLAAPDRASRGPRPPVEVRDERDRRCCRTCSPTSTRRSTSRRPRAHGPRESATPDLYRRSGRVRRPPRSPGPTDRPARHRGRDTGGRRDGLRGAERPGDRRRRHARRAGARAGVRRGLRRCGGGTTAERVRWAIAALNDAAVRELAFRGTPEMFPGADEYADR